MKLISFLRHRPFLAVVGVSLLVLLSFEVSRRRGQMMDPASAAEDLEAAGRCDAVQLATSSADALFTKITDLAVDSRGRIHVAGDDSKITVLSAMGEVLEEIGRRGKGPGEFSEIANLQILPGDTLLVYDREIGRITLLSPDSRDVVRTINLPQTTALPVPQWVSWIPGSGGYLTGRTAYFRLDSDPAVDYDRQWSIDLLDDAGSVRRQAVLPVRAPQTTLVARGAFGGQQAILAMPNPFGRPGKLRVSPDGQVYYGFGDSLAISIYSPEGSQVGGFSRTYQAPPITRQNVETYLPRDGADDPTAQQFLTLLRPALDRFLDEHTAGRWPAFQNFVVDERGLIWLGLAEGEVDPVRKASTSTSEWAIFEPSGAHRCTAGFPEPTELMAVSGDGTYGVVTDALDVPRVVVYRVEGLR